MAEENKENVTGAVEAPEAGSDQDSAYHRRRRAFWNASNLELSAKKAVTKVFREFVLSEDNGALVWRSARVAHEAAGFKREDFERSLENSDQMKPDQWIYHKAHNRRKDPYKQLLLQEWIKYLYYGGSRRKRKIVGKNAKGEPIMADYLATLDPSIFVLDYDHNAPNVAHLQATHEPMFRAIRAAHPDLPILMMTRPLYRYTPDDMARLEVVRTTYLHALADGDKNAWVY